MNKITIKFSFETFYIVKNKSSSFIGGTASYCDLKNCSILKHLHFISHITTDIFMLRHIN